MPATLKLQRLDRRYDGNDRFTHRIEFKMLNRDRQGMLTAWIRSRIWLWNNYGPSAELFLARADYFDGEQPKWAWDSNKSAIYLREDALQMFLLKKELWEK